MATETTRFAVWTVALVLAVAGRSHADDMKRIRTDSQYLQAAVDEAADRSPTLRAIIGEIGASNVIVHITCGQWKSAVLEGQTLWVSAGADVRYLRVQIDCMLQRTELAAIIGHELQHVAEVAAAEEVMDGRSFVRLFNRIGFASCRVWREQYETERAIRTGQRVRQEFTSGKRSVTPKLTAAP